MTPTTIQGFLDAGCWAGPSEEDLDLWLLRYHVTMNPRNNVTISADRLAYILCVELYEAQIAILDEAADRMHLPLRFRIKAMEVHIQDPKVEMYQWDTMICDLMAKEMM